MSFHIYKYTYIYACEYVPCLQVSWVIHAHYHYDPVSATAIPDPNPNNDCRDLVMTINRESMTM
jgi:hypothetical protein